MFTKTDKCVIAGLSYIAVSNLVDAIKIRRRIKQIDVEIQEQTLDLAATRKAHDTMIQRIHEGYYDDNPNFYADYTREIEFEKIAIRLQD